MIGERAIAAMLVWSCMLVLACPRVIAQSTGKLRIFCEPQGTSLYIVDDKHRLNDREITLMEGPHRFTFWAPERRMLDTTLMVVAGTTREAHVQLRYSEEYIAYRAEADRYTRNARWKRYGPPLVTLGAGAWAGLSISRAINARKDLDALEEEYTTSAYPTGITELKDERIPEANTELRQARTMAYISSGVFVASAAVSYLMHRRSITRTAPIFDDKEKLRFDGLVWAPGANGEGVWMASLMIPIR